MKKWMTATGLAVLFVLAGFVSSANAQGPGDHHRGGVLAQLTDDQRAQLHDLIEEMRAAGATPEEIREAVAALLTQFGIEPPEKPRGGDRLRRIMRLLTEEQRAAIREMIGQMKENGATRDEIWQAIVAQLKEWGIEPSRHGGDFLPGLRRIMQQLTEEQRAQVVETIRQMREAGATPEEIRDAVTALLTQFGVELPQRNDWRERLRQVMEQLTPEQRSQIRQTIHRMREAGNTPQEIREAVMALLREFGVEFPSDEPSTLMSDQPEIVALNYPNPFNLDTRITYTLPSAAPVHIQIYNMAGQEIRSFQLGYQTEGEHYVMWDGLTASGAAAPSGIYFYRIDAGGRSFTQRMLLVK